MQFSFFFNTSHFTSCIYESNGIFPVCAYFGVLIGDCSTAYPFIRNRMNPMGRRSDSFNTWRPCILPTNPPSSHIHSHTGPESGSGFLKFFFVIILFLCFQCPCMAMQLVFVCLFVCFLDAV